MTRRIIIETKDPKARPLDIIARALQKSKSDAIQALDSFEILYGDGGMLASGDGPAFRIVLLCDEASPESLAVANDVTDFIQSHPDFDPNVMSIELLEEDSLQSGGANS